MALCVIRKLKFAAGLFILVNHADMKSLKVHARVPAGAPLSTPLQRDIVFQLCFLSSPLFCSGLLLLSASVADCHVALYHGLSGAPR